MKKCPVCKITKDESDFYKNISRKDKISGLCKLCSCKAINKYRCSKQGIAKVIQYKRSKQGKTAQRNADKKRATTHPEIIKAINDANNAIRANKLIKEPCEFCGIEYKIEAHHHNYNQPLNVMWLCRTCHRILHGVI